MLTSLLEDVSLLLGSAKVHMCFFPRSASTQAAALLRCPRLMRDFAPSDVLRAFASQITGDQSQIGIERQHIVNIERLL